MTSNCDFYMSLAIQDSKRRSHHGHAELIPYPVHFEMTPGVSVNFISLVTSCVGLREEEPQTALPRDL